jgi:hypothetical protein
MMFISTVVFSTVVLTPPFPVYWNVEEVKEPPVDVTTFGIRPRNSTQVGNACAQDPPPHSNPGCRSWTQGLFPTIDDNGTWINGGVPQAADLKRHLHAIEVTLPGWIPDASWSGNAVLDFESWTNVFELNNGNSGWHGKRYQIASRHLVKQKHPDWNETAIEAAAKREFEAAATSWFVATLRKCREIRPNARWGFYGLPAQAQGNCIGHGPSLKCGYDNPNATELRHGVEVTQMPVWRASTALFPSIYIPHAIHGDTEMIRAYIQSSVRESVRVAKLAAAPDGTQLGVYPYGWDHYHAPPTPPVRMDVAFVLAQLQHSADLGAAGVVFWGDPVYSDPGHTADYWAWVRNVSGPAVRQWCAGRPGGC